MKKSKFENKVNLRPTRPNDLQFVVIKTNTKDEIYAIIDRMPREEGIEGYLCVGSNLIIIKKKLLVISHIFLNSSF